MNTLSWALSKKTPTNQNPNIKNQDFHPSCLGKSSNLGVIANESNSRTLLQNRGDTMSNKAIRNGKGHRAYRRKQRILKNRRLPCAWCGHPIDYSLPYTHPMSFTADHPEAIGNGGHLVRQDLEPMHRKCNAQKGASQKVNIRPAS